MKKVILEKSFSEIGKECEQYMKQKSYANEVDKGCTDKLNSEPVSLEPMFQSYRVEEFGSRKQLTQETILYSPEKNNITWSYLRVWLAKKDELKSREAFASLINSFSSLNKWGIFLGGNKNQIMIIFAVPKNDVFLAKNALLTQYPHAEIAITEENPLFKKTDFEFTEHYTPSPYNSVLNSPENSLASGILQCLSNLETDEFAFFQLLIHPCKNDWGNNIYHLCHAERNGGVPNNKWRTNGYGSEYIDQAKQKLHSPLHAVIIRTCVKSKNSSAILKSLNSTLFAYRWRGETLKQIPKQHFIKKLGIKKINNMLLNLQSHRAGSIQSAELNSLPCAEIKSSFHS